MIVLNLTTSRAETRAKAAYIVVRRYFHTSLGNSGIDSRFIRLYKNDIAQGMIIGAEKKATNGQI